MLLFDIETDGFLEALTRVHCLVIKDTETGEVTRYNDQEGERIKLGVMRLVGADKIAGHNIIDFDLPALKKVYPWFTWRIDQAVDTLVWSKIAYANIKDRDFKAEKKYGEGKWIEKKNFGRHSLESWGQRLGCPKDDYSARMKEQGLDPWAEWNQMMEDYCVQDVESNDVLLKKLEAADVPMEAVMLECHVQHIIVRQQNWGFRFDLEKAKKLHTLLLGKKLELEAELREYFPPFLKRNGKATKFKKTMRRKNPTGFREETTEGGDYQKIKLVDFNPGSRDHIAMRLQVQYGWKPKEFGKDGKPSVDETVLGTLHYPPVEKLIEYLTVEKRLGQLAEGKEAWLKQVKDDGRMHGRVNSLGAVTARMTHSNPNVAQTPASYSPYGHECRELFTASSGWFLTGADAEGLELRGLGHYMAKWDGGAYSKAVVEGNKDDGTDAHTLNQKAIGLNTRDNAKTWFYAFIYGAGDFKLGTIVYDDMTPEQRKSMGKVTDRKLVQLGRKSRDAIARGLPALGALVKAVKKAAKRGYLRGPDRRKVFVRAAHSALNTLLQHAGALIMKKALVILDEELQGHWLLGPGLDYEFAANVHDEWQVDCRTEDIAHSVGRVACDAIKRAGEFYDFKCPLAGAYDVGRDWSATH